MAGQVPRPWFRLGSITRPATTTTTAPVTEQPRPAPALVRPPIIRPAAEPNSPLQSSKPPSVANAKSPTPPPPPRPTTSLPSSPTLTPSAKKAASPSTMFTRPVLPSRSDHVNGERGGSANSSPPQKAAASPAFATMPPARPSSPPFSGSESKARASVPASPTHGETHINTKLVARDSPSPVPSPTVVRHSIPAVPSPNHSPKPKTGPPSPLVLPPPQLQPVGDHKHVSIPQEVERKAVVVQKIIDKPIQPDHHYSSYHAHNPSFGQNGKQEPNKHEEQSKDKGTRAKKVLGSDQESNTRFITMAGENRGAFMEVVLSDKNNSNSRHHQIGRNNKEEDGNRKNNNDPKLDDTINSKKAVGIRSSSSLPMKAFFNSNVQGINNSILMDSSFSHHDPGIHIVFSRIPSSAKEVPDGQ